MGRSRFSLALAAVLYQFVGRYLIGYRVRPNCIEVIAFSVIPVWRIALGNIAGVREARFKSFRDFVNPRMFGRYLFALRLGNRVFGRRLLIELKGGVIRAVFISPDDPSEFVAALQHRLPAVPLRDG